MSGYLHKKINFSEASGNLLTAPWENLPNTYLKPPEKVAEWATHPILLDIN
jgi:hypothetical protein